MNNSPSADFEIQVAQFTKRKKTFCVHKKRGTKVMYFGEDAVAISKQKKKKSITDKALNREVVNLIANVAKNINAFIVSSNFSFDIEEERHSSTWTNRELYKTLQEGKEFYYIDIAHCFWRIAFLKGYISQSMYKSILKKPHLKTYRNMALACVIAPSSRDYYIRGVKTMSIEEDKTLQRLIYDNIRFTCYNLMGDIVSAIGEQYVIGYRTDGILVLPEKKDAVIQMIIEQDFKCTEKKMTKVDDSFYQHSNGTKKHL